MESFVKSVHAHLTYLTVFIFCIFLQDRFVLNGNVVVVSFLGVFLAYLCWSPLKALSLQEGKGVRD